MRRPLADPVTTPRFAGRFVERGQPGYEEARVGRVFNGRRPDRFPAAVLLAADEDDVVAGVRLAKARGAQVSVRSGGHSWAAWSVRDDALLIDLGGLRDIRLRPGDRDRRGPPGRPGRHRAGSLPGRTGARVPRRALRVGRPGWLPAPGRPGLEQPVLGLGLRERGGHRRGHRGRPPGARRRGRERRPVLGRARRRARFPRPGHQVLPAHLSAAAGHDAGHLDVPGAGGGAAAGLAARDPAGAGPDRGTRRRGHAAARCAAGCRGGQTHGSRCCCCTRR